MAKLSRKYPRSLWSSNYVADHSEASGSYCFNCSSYLSWEQYFSIGENFMNGVRSRHSCGSLLNYGRIRPNCTEDTLRSFSDMSLYEQTWYHATQKRNWYDRIKDRSLLVHVGDELTALCRADSLYDEIQAPTYLYSFKVSTDAIRHVLLKDEDHWPSRLTPKTELLKTDGGVVVHSSGYSGYPYQNLFENSGSISLLIAASSILEDTVNVTRLARR